MANILVLGAGVMGSAITVPLTDAGHVVRLVGTHLDAELIASIRQARFHPRLRSHLPESVAPYTNDQLGEAMHGADLVFNFTTDYALFNETDITKIPGTPAQLTGLSLYNATALSDLTTASPKYVVNLGALNLFDRYPNKLNDVLRSHYDNLAYNDNLGVLQYPSFSPFDQNFGIHCARCDCFNGGGKDISCT